MPRKTSSAALAKRAKRREEIAKRLLAGHTHRQIAADLGIALQTIVDDVKVIKAQWRAENSATVQEIVDKNALRLETALSVVWNKAMDGDLRALEALQSIIAQLVKLTGADPAQRIKVVGADGGPLQVEAGVQIDVTKLSPEQLKALREMVSP